MQQWWDTSSAAGPKSRAAQTFSEEIPGLDCLIVLDNELKSLGLKYTSFCCETSTQ